MSNRFRRLKLTHTLRHGLPPNRLAPFHDNPGVLLDATMKAENRKDTNNSEPSGAMVSPSGAPMDDFTIAWTDKSKESGKMLFMNLCTATLCQCNTYTDYLLFLLSPEKLCR